MYETEKKEGGRLLTFRDRVEAMRAASQEERAGMRRDIRGEFAVEMRASGVAGSDLCVALGVTNPALSSYVRGVSRFTYPRMKHILWILAGDFRDRARALIMASPEEAEGMVREVGEELYLVAKEEGVPQGAVAAAVGVAPQDFNKYVLGRRNFTHAVLEKVVWLLDGEKKGEGRL